MGLLVPMQGSTMQVIFGTVVALVFMLFQVQTAPFKSLQDDYLSSAWYVLMSPRATHGCILS